MRKLLTILFYLPLFAGAQTTPLTFTQISGSTDVPSYGRGAEYWNNELWNNTANNGVNMPAGNSTLPPTNFYTRYTWKDIESDVTQGLYDWTKVDQRFHAAMDLHQVFSFGIMPICDGCGTGQIPTYLHNLQQAEPTLKDWFYATDGLWIPNWNSNSYQSRYRALLQAIANHIATTSYKPAWSAVNIPYSSVVYQVDIRGFGNFGEWHTSPWNNDGAQPANAHATQASLDSLITMNLQVFPNFQNVILIGAFTTNASSFVPVEVSYRALTSTNNYGRIGWRRDNYGDPGYSSILENNPETYNPGTGTVSISSLIMNQYKFAPIAGEPINNRGDNYADVGPEVTRYHTGSMGNGNFANPTNATTQLNYQNAMLSSGYRLVLTGGSMTTTLVSGGGFNVQVIWSNLGLAPTYENWTVKLELRNPITHAVVWSGTSTFNPKPLLPGAPLTQNDNFTLGTVANGTYDMYMGVTDPLNYELPLALAITGRGADGYYPIRTGISVGGVANVPPIARITGTANVTLPGTASLSGTTSSDPDGTITAFAWSFVSGPNTPTIGTPTAATSTISGLAVGTYVIRLTVTDNNSATGTADWTINVATANVPPTAKITFTSGSASITLPVDSVRLSGATSTDDGTIVGYAWTQVSGPNTATRSSPTAVTCAMGGMIAGTYVFQLVVTDNNGATGSTQQTVNVNNANIPPTARITFTVGSASITLPTNSVTLSGLTSTDADGTIVGYAWTQVSGPSTATRSTPTASTCAMGSLIGGTYVFQLVVTDNSGGTGTTQQTVSVSNANVPPTAIITPAGSITIQLPTSSQALSGTTSTDPDGSITAYSWTFVSGPNTPTIGTPTASTSTISGMIAGTYVIKLTVTDNSSATGSVNKTIVVTAPNASPTAQIIGSDTVHLPVNSVSVNGSTSFDPDGSIVSYLWTNISGPNTPTIITPTSAITNITGLIAGTYLFKLLVTDNSAATGADTITVVVVPSNGGTSVTVFTSQTPAGNISGFTTQTPTTNLFNDGIAVNLGVKFRSSVATNVIGVRFWKGVGNNGTHQGQLYDSLGGLLATGTFAGETASGWQTLIFASPVPILANRTYVAAYFSPNGTYNDNNNYFTAAVTNGTITLLADGTSGPNGVYKYNATPAFPNVDNTHKPNYWVDPIVDGGGTLQNDGQPITLGMKFRSSVAGTITGIRFYKIQGNNGTHIGLLYSGTGAVLAQATFGSESSGGWQTVMFSTPVSIQANTTYVAAYFSPLGTYVEDAIYFLTSGINNSPLTGLQNGVDGPNGVYRYGASPMFPTSTDNGGNYWVDAIFAPPIPPPPFRGFPRRLRSVIAVTSQ